MSLSKSPIFIGGLMKSGTSLLRKLLTLHPNIFGGLETHWYSDEFINHYKDGNSVRQKWLLDFFDVTNEEVAPLRKASVNGFEFFDLFMNYCTKRDGKMRWVEKTPDNVFHIQTIWQNWPNAKIIILKRDFKDVYASWKKNKKRSFEFFLNQATEYLQIIETYNNHENFMTINYESLVNDTKFALNEVLEFIGEPYKERLENYQGDLTDYNKVLEITGKVSPTTISLSKPIFSSSIGQWKEILSSAEEAVLNRL